jgi:hypothetical protein
MFAAGVLAGFSCLLTPTLKKGEKRGEMVETTGILAEK